jgi:hypothetical protein
LVVVGILLGCSVAVASYIAATIRSDKLLPYEVTEETAGEGVIVSLEEGEEQFRGQSISASSIARG